MIPQRKRPQSFIPVEVPVSEPIPVAVKPPERLRWYLVLTGTSVYSWGNEEDAMAHYDMRRKNREFSRTVATPFWDEPEDVWNQFFSELDATFEARKQVIRDRTNGPLTYTVRDKGYNLYDGAEIFQEVDPHKMGQQARAAGDPQDANPYTGWKSPKQRRQWVDWNAGWREANDLL